MTLARIAILSLQVSVFLIVFSLGLEATWESATSLFRRPAMLLRSFLSVNVVMPLFAAGIAAAFHFSPAVKIALIFLAVSPLPPLLPQKQLKFGGRADYVYGLLTALSVLSIAVVPLAVEILGKLFGRDVHVGPFFVAEVVFRTVLLPLGLGMLVHRWAPGFAQKAGVALGKLGNVLLLIALVPLLIFTWRQVVSLISHGDLLAMILFTAVGLMTGHWLGGPDARERKTLALATAVHHPGLAIAIAAANFPAQRLLVAAAVVLYLLVSAAVLLPYNAWCKRRMTGGSEGVVSQSRAA
jgi:bile acid:Na+ symporter, BASS family